jgi:hypothetical protein
MRSILVAIAKNEGRYIREWVLYHRLICEFDAIHIYENDSEDDTKNELSCLSEQGLCTYEAWPRGPGKNPPQQTAYANALRKFKNKCDWLCYMDLDEFLVLNSHDNIGDFVSGFDERTGSVSFNWLMFYSLDQRMTDKPVIERVNYCYPNAHVKTIARTEAINNFGIHTFSLVEGYKYMHSSGLEYRLDDRINTSLDAKICTKPEYWICEMSKAHINHYHMKSEEEVKEKDAKGRATVAKYVPKKIINHYLHAKRKKNHIENSNIKNFIEKKFGLEKFYSQCCVR